MDLIEHLDKRFQYRRFKEDKIPPKELIEKIIRETINLIPVKNEGYNFKLEIWGPECYEEKRKLAIITIAQKEYMFGPDNFGVDEDEWYENAKKLYEYEENNNWIPETKDGLVSYFNIQVRAPYLISIVLSPEKWNPKEEPVWAQLDSFMAGMFSYGLSIIANNYGINCAFCSCFEKGLKNHFNFITTPHDTVSVRGGKKSNCLTLIGLGYYDLLQNQPHSLHANHMHLSQQLGWKKPFNRSLIKPKPKIEDIVEWK